MKNFYLSFIMSATIVVATFAVQPELTDLPDAYGEQLKNSTFNGEWNDITYIPAGNGASTTGKEPVGWHSFLSGGGMFIDAAAQNAFQLNYSSDLRPGAPENEKSCRINSRAVVIGSNEIIANGNITTGKINAGSISAIHLGSNYNYTIRPDESNDYSIDYATPFSSKPDSITVWVKLITNSDDNNARVSVLLHNSFDCRDAPSREDDRNSIGGFAEARFNRKGQVWQRLSIPFKYFPETYISFNTFNNSGGTKEYDIKNVQPEYILVTFTTNERGGGGTGVDTLLIDDILMVYKPKVHIASLQTVENEENTFQLDYTISGTMSPYNLNAEANEVIVELSDADGSFDSPTVLDNKESDVSGNFTLTLEPELFEGNYKLRLRTTNYPAISNVIPVETGEFGQGIKNAKVPQFSILPNPVREQFTVRSEQAIERVDIFNTIGMLVLTQQADGNETTVQVSNLPKGIYFVKAGKVMQKMIKN